MHSREVPASFRRTASTLDRTRLTLSSLNPRGSNNTSWEPGYGNQRRGRL